MKTKTKQLRRALTSWLGDAAQFRGSSGRWGLSDCKLSANQERRSSEAYASRSLRPHSERETR